MIKLYRYFKSHPLIFWLSMLLSTAFFVYFGLKVTYEEDITKLLPSSGSSEAMGLAFSDLKVKDKIFVQFVNPDNVLDGAARTNTLPQQAEACDYFMDVLMRADSAEHDIDNDMLYRIQKPDAGELMDPLIFLTEHVPSFVDESMYAGMDTIFSAERLNEQMIQNATGDDETLAEMDPFGMRGLLMGSFQGLNGGFSMYEDEADGQDPEAETVHLMTTDSTEILAFLSPSFKSLDSGTGTRLVRKLDLAVDSVRARYPMVDVYYHGAPINSVGNSQRIKLDLLFTLGLSILIIGILIMLSFRNHGTLPLLVLPIVYGAFFALTVIYFMQGSMSLMALGLGAIVLGVALSYCLHVLTHYKYVSDPEQVLREQVKPVLMGSLTTIGAFAGLLLTQSALLRDFGLFALLSVAGTTFACLAFMPQFFRPANNRRSERAFRLMERINNYPIERQNRLIILLLVLTVITCAFSFNVGFDEDLKHIGYFTDRIAKAQQLYAQKTTEGRKSQFYAVQASTLDEALHYNVGFHEACDGLVKSGYIHSYARLTGKLLVDSATQEARISAWKRYFDDNYDIFTQRIRQAALSAGLDPDYYVERLDELAAGDYETADVYAQIVDWNLLPSGLLTNF
ncbi:MAG: MMPL family transporter, partial [Paludibacteraceae bacterium]|nr:MMPL family transporter [Paludibacteraceae bacterium]